MAQHYIDESRADATGSLPDCETWQADALECTHCGAVTPFIRLPCECGSETLRVASRDRWWYWYCFPGCMPDSDPMGPYDSETEALAAAREDAGYCPHGFDDETPCETCDAEYARMRSAFGLGEGK